MVAAITLNHLISLRHGISLIVLQKWLLDNNTIELTVNFASTMNSGTLFPRRGRFLRNIPILSAFAVSSSRINQPGLLSTPEQKQKKIFKFRRGKFHSSESQTTQINYVIHTYQKFPWVNLIKRCLKIKGIFGPRTWARLFTKKECMSQTSCSPVP